MIKLILRYYESKYMEDGTIGFLYESLEKAKEDLEKLISERDKNYGEFEFVGHKFDDHDIRFSVQTLHDFWQSILK